MTTLKEGDKAPDLNIPASNGKNAQLSTYKGKKLVVYFYPKDSTPGCTKEACGFTDLLPQFQKLGVDVIGISKDSLKRHENFITKYDLKILLASDEEGEVCKRYGVWVEKKNYGRTYMGIQRATFLIDESGHLAKIWPKVKVAGHVEEVMDAVKNLKAAA